MNNETQKVTIDTKFQAGRFWVVVDGIYTWNENTMEEAQELANSYK